VSQGPLTEDDIARARAAVAARDPPTSVIEMCALNDKVRPVLLADSVTAGEFFYRLSVFVRSVSPDERIQICGVIADAGTLALIIEVLNVFVKDSVVLCSAASFLDLFFQGGHKYVEEFVSQGGLTALYAAARAHSMNSRLLVAVVRTLCTIAESCPSVLPEMRRGVTAGLSAIFLDRARMLGTTTYAYRLIALLKE